MNSQVYTSTGEEQTLEIGRKIGSVLQPPKVILLEGCLGAGKTALTRGIVSGYFGLPFDRPDVRSPTFSLVNQYEHHGRVVFHIDLYRLDTAGEQYSIGLDEILSEEAVIIIEWSEKLKVPADYQVNIRLWPTDSNCRKIEIPNELLPS